MSRMGVEFGTAREVGLLGFDDYEIYRMLCYEDDLGKATSRSSGTRDPSRIALRQDSDRPPEECWRRFLKPDQAAFFRGIYLNI